MSRAVFAVPGDLSTPTGGYAYDRRIIAGLTALGWSVDVLDLGDGFPAAGEERKDRAAALLLGTPRDAALVIDGLALGVLPRAAARLKATHRVIALVHHPLACESGLREDVRQMLQVSERAALAHVRGVVVTSASTAKLLARDYGVPETVIAVVRPGSERVPAAAGSGDGLSLLAVGSVVPRKGYDVLVAALAAVKDLPWTLTIAGDLGRDPAAARNLETAIARHGLQRRIVLAGAVPDEALAALYERADLFVLASRFEGYGMALADAVAYGLPVVATKAGAIPEAVPADAGILVPPDDVAALASALRRVIGNETERFRLAANARAAASCLPSWDDQAKLFARAIGHFA